jgi:hypothetical protein
LLAAPKWLELETSGVLHIIFWLRFIQQKNFSKKAFSLKGMYQRL